MKLSVKHNAEILVGDYQFADKVKEQVISLLDEGVPSLPHTTNVNASVAQNALVRNERNMNTAMERLSTGQRINSASDDAAGLAIGSRMTSQIRGLETGIRNANDAISMINTADGALIEVTNMLQRMRELALQSANGTTTSADRNYLSSEYANLLAEIDRIAENTQWNGKTILNHTTTASSTFKYHSILCIHSNSIYNCGSTPYSQVACYCKVTNTCVIFIGV